MSHLFVHFQICINGAHLIISLHQSFTYLKSSSFLPLLQKFLCQVNKCWHNYFIFLVMFVPFSSLYLWRPEFLLELLFFWFNDPVLFGLGLVFWIIFFLLISGLHCPFCPQTLEIEFFCFCYLYYVLFIFYNSKYSEGDCFSYSLNDPNCSHQVNYQVWFSRWASTYEPGS